MKSSFFEFHVASSALFTAKSALQTVGHNIANNTTKGYSRQYVEQRATTPLATYNAKGMVGTGSEVYGIGQVRSFYLDQKYWNERCIMGEYSTKNAQLSLMESIFNEFASTSTSGNFDSFFATLQDLSTNTPDATYRNNILKTAESLATFINSTASSLKKQQLDINSEVATLVSIINNLGEQIANLNEKISKYEIDGSRANDLRDQRALLVDELSLYVNVDVKEEEFNPDYASGKYPNPEDRGKSDKRYSILINGFEFVNSWECNGINVVERTESQKRNKMDAKGLYDIVFDNGVQFDLYSSTLKGELKGLIDTRDGNNADKDGANGTLTQIHDYKGIPHYLNKLNKLVQVFARAINEGLDYKGEKIPDITGHNKGYDKNGNLGDALFTYTKNNGDEATIADLNSGNPYEELNAFNFKVSAKILNDPFLLACSSEANSGESNNKIILGFANLGNYASLFREGKILDYVTGVTGELGIDAKQAKNFTSNYKDVTTNIDNQRMQVSGVSLNEEVLSMVQYQQQFVAASKLMSVINDIYDTVINKMGV